MNKITVIGGGLAGCEAAYYIASHNIKVDLYEMKKIKKTPAQHTELLGELVCSNSLKGNRITNACGLLKEELRMLGSLCMEASEKAKVPAGDALAVDRDVFSEYITEKIRKNPNINVIDEEITEIPGDGIVIIATGPLTSEALAESIGKILGEKNLYFYDAAAPVVTKESIDMNICYKMARYNKGGDDYINCPFTKEQYDSFYNELINAETVPLKEFEGLKVFEGCMPVEVMAKRGEKTLTFGPLKPVGLDNPVTGEKYHAVVQLRRENKEDTLYNLVGFQTNLKFGEQKRVFSMIPGLENAEFVRLGVMHRNTYINSPVHLLPTGQLKKNERIFFAGQITGVEGYVESMASGLFAGINAVRILLGEKPVVFPKKTALGSLISYITDETVTNFQPMNMNFGILPKLPERIKSKVERYEKTAEIALEEMREFIDIYSKNLEKNI